MEHYEELLLTKREELTRDLGQREGIAVERTADALDDVQGFLDREFIVNNLNRNWYTLRNVDLALARIRRGEYGICLRCEGKIGDKRLRALPWATYCLRCQEIEDAHRQNDQPAFALAEAA